jgi:hypothetical protein
VKARDGGQWENGEQGRGRHRKPGRLRNMTAVEKLATSVLPELIGCPKTSKVQSGMLNTWPESMANVDPRVWESSGGEGMSRAQLFESLENFGLRCMMSPQDSSHWTVKRNHCRCW